MCVSGFPGGSDGKESACNAGDLGLIPGLERSPGEGNGNPLQYSCLENSMDKGTWWATVHGVTQCVFSCVRLFTTLWTVACQAPLSMGFPWQEYWNGLSFPPLGDLANPGIEPRSATLQVDSLPSEPSGKLMNTGVGSLSLLQGIFPTQESTWGLLHYRRILYELSYQGSPMFRATNQQI